MKKIGLSILAATLLFATEVEYSIGMGKYYNDIKSYNVVNFKLGQYLKNRDILKLSLEQSLPIKIDGKNYYITKLELLYNKPFKNDTLEQNNLRPYLIGGIGGAYSTSSQIDSGLLATAGIGLKYAQDKKVNNNLFIEFRVTDDFANSKINYGILFGIDYRFFYKDKTQQNTPATQTNNKTTKAKTTQAPVTQNLYKDSDGDGVINALDECPNTPVGVTVNSYGCPIDSDQDGVADYIDKCPFTPPHTKVNQYGCAIDTDNDGVVDSIDKCPNTPAGVRVDKFGCAIYKPKPKPKPRVRVSVPKVVVPEAKVNATLPKKETKIVMDSDFDGVPDNKDKCPNTPIGMLVNAQGCPIQNMDSDGDGVVDSKDKCPNTLPGAKVDSHGCMYEFDFKIKFRKNSTKVNPIYYPRIKMFAEYLKAHPKYSAEIQGYTDSKGPARYNKILSEKRAKAVYELLIKFGVSPQRLSYFGYGEENPIYPNGKYGNPKNRRVVAKIYKN